MKLKDFRAYYQLIACTLFFKALLNKMFANPNPHSSSLLCICYNTILYLNSFTPKPVETSLKAA